MTKKYKKIKEIGRGSRAKVYLVRNTDTDDLLAMKVYPSENKPEANGFLEAERELLVLKQLKKKGIPYLADCIKNMDEVCILMEYIEGKSLRRLMDEKHILDEAYAADLAYRIAELLCAFHENTPAWIYADLKPENIMLSDKGDIYLVDFGSVLIAGEKNHPVHGTKAYLPVCEEEISPYRDTYALGVILYEMLTGFTYADGIKRGKADISHLSKPCRELLQKAVKIRPEEGYSDAKGMKADIQSWAESLSGACRRAKKTKMKGGIFVKNGQRKRGQNHDNNYYIGDTRRFIRHGLLKYTAELAVCCLVITLAVLAETVIKKKEIEAAVNVKMAQTETVSEIPDEAAKPNGREEISQEDRITEYEVYTQPIGNHVPNKAVVVYQLSRN